MNLLKANLHCHTKDDPQDIISYSAYEAIQKAAEYGFEVLALTCHDAYTWNESYAAYAETHGILLIPGIEKTIEGRHVVILNADPRCEQIETFEALRAYKEKMGDSVLLIAPHPFFPASYALQEKLIQHISLFDAIEYSWFHTKFMNWNNKTNTIAQRYNLPIIATSDTHELKFLNTSFTTIRSEKKTIASIFDAIKKNNIHNISRHLSFAQEIIPYLSQRMYKKFTSRKIMKRYPYQADASL